MGHVPDARDRHCSRYQDQQTEMGKACPHEETLPGREERPETMIIINKFHTILEDIKGSGEI